LGREALHFSPEPTFEHIALDRPANRSVSVGTDAEEKRGGTYQGKVLL